MTRPRILVDATPRGGRPGTLYLIEPTVIGPDAPGDPCLIEAHTMDPAKVVRLAAAMGGRVDCLLLVGCEPEPPGDSDDMRDTLSEPVRAAVDEAVNLIGSLTARLLRGERIEARGAHVIVEKEVEPCRD